LKYYGQSVDNFTALAVRLFDVKDEFLFRHFTGAFVFWMLLLVTGLIAKEITGSFYASAITVVALVLVPRLFGHAFGNLKDIPFAAGYMAGIYMIIKYFKEMPDPRWRTAVLLGLAIAFTVSVRAGGFILFAYLGLFMIIYLSWKPFALKQIVSTKPVFVRLLGQGAVIIITGYFAGLLFWPFALQNVWVHPFESLSVMKHYTVSIRQIFEGELIWSTDLPWYYLPKWIFISTPLFVFFGFLIYSYQFVKQVFIRFIVNRKIFFEFIVWFSALFPFLYVIAIDSNLYSGVRQMLFVLPPFVLLASVGVYKVLENNKKRFIRLAVPLVFVLLMIFPLKHQAKTFPVDYVYFNCISGGNKKAWSNFEYDYYFHGIKKPVQYFKDSLANKESFIVATNCNLSNYFNGEKMKYQYTRYLERSSHDWDYAIFGVSYIHPELLKNNTWQSNNIVKTFYHRKNPVAVILSRKDKSDFLGIQAMHNGEYKRAEHLLKKAVENDPNNVWLFVNLSKIALFQENKEKFLEYMTRGRNIYPDYEPFYLLEGQLHYNEGAYRLADSKMKELLRINPRYDNAKPLIEAIKEKMYN
jgi:hypothetical protein